MLYLEKFSRITTREICTYPVKFFFLCYLQRLFFYDAGIIWQIFFVKIRLFLIVGRIQL